MTIPRFGKGTMLAAALGLMVATSGCDTGEEAPGETVAPLSGGSAAGGVGVVRLSLWTGVRLTPLVTCTGTIIANNRIVTAAHCFDTWLTIHDHHDVTYLLEGDGILARVDYTDDGANWTCLTNPTDTVCGPTVAAFAPMHVSRMSGDGNTPDVALLRFATPFTRIRSNRFRQLSTQDLRLKQALEEWGAGATDPTGAEGDLPPVSMKRAVQRITAFNATSFDTANTSAAQTCDGDSGGPAFAGASDLVVGVLRSASPGTGTCGTTSSTNIYHRITPPVINFINNHRQGSDTACVETIAGTGFYKCS
jgi:hypothetical protein